MLKNLMLEICLQKIGIRELAHCLNMNEFEFIERVENKNKQFTLDECFKMKEKFFPYLTLDYLFGGA